MISLSPGDWRGQIAITHTGLVSPVGYDAASSIAAMRAGISRLAELPYLEIEADEDEYGPVVGAEIPEVPRGRQGLPRLVRLLAQPLAEISGHLRELNGSTGSAWVATAHPEEGGRVLDHSADLARETAQMLGSLVPIRDCQAVPAGRAAGLHAVRLAATEISRGELDFAVVCATDSWISASGLGWLQEQGKLREFPRKTGILPGEAAACLILEPVDKALNRKSQILATLSALAGELEAPESETLVQSALAETVAFVAEGISESEALVVSDLNGERYRALEWANVISRSLWYYRNLRHWHPAEYIGDSGAASGLACLIWAATALQKNYARADNVLVWGASDQGLREAAMVNQFRSIQ